MPAVRVTVRELEALCERAALQAGAAPAQAAALARATAEAEALGRSAVGVGHLPDYLDGFATGRIATDPPQLFPTTPVLGRVDCRAGLAQHGFELGEEWLAGAARRFGLAGLSVHDCFTVGELGHYVRRLARRGLFALAAANAPALMAVGGSRVPLLGTNPLAFGVDLPDGRLLLVDQASSGTAWVALRAAARAGEELPEGLALDRDGAPTTSAVDALAGALLPFGGHKGGNVALLVELLALLAGGTPSLDAAPFDTGSASPRVGMTVLALDPDRLHPGYRARLADLLARWSAAGADTSYWTGWTAAEEVDLGDDPARLVPEGTG